MRILQLIDSLEVGGAERIAVNYANALSNRIEFSGIVATRKEGALRSRIDHKVFFNCLEKRFTFDLISIFRLRSICKTNQVKWVHAHGTSYFTAFLLKLVHPRIEIIWHEHAGARSEKMSIHNIILWVLSRAFCGIVVVNHNLEHWCKTKLGFDRVIYLPNFTVINHYESKETFLKGFADKRIVCLANLRHPKNHKLLIEVAIRLRDSNPDWTFHFIGNDLQDNYAAELKTMIASNKLEESVFLYGMCQDIDHILEQSAIGVIASTSEGLPVALLEYGMHKKAVVVTNVGEIPLIVNDGVNGFVVKSNSVELFQKALVQLINSSNLRSKFGGHLGEVIDNNHSENAVVSKYINWIKDDLKC
ncbi:MAG: glycosyltransferase family 4 protein [Flavobacterium sp.]|nr:glycosyltransferase family 4 protein [Flavobacterium sp.]